MKYLKIFNLWDNILSIVNCNGRASHVPLRMLPKSCRQIVGHCCTVSFHTLRILSQPERIIACKTHCTVCADFFIYGRLGSVFWLPQSTKSFSVLCLVFKVNMVLTRARIRVKNNLGWKQGFET